MLLVVESQAQRQVSNTWANQANTIFDGLDKSFVPHGILLDYAMEFTDVPVYNGNLTSQNYIDTNVYSDIYKTLCMGKVDALDSQLPQLKDVAEAWLQFRDELNSQERLTLVLLGLVYEYAAINENALSQNKITVSNNKYFDKYINGVWQNPYDSKKALAITPPLQTLKQRSFDIYFPSSLFYSNNSQKVRNVFVNLSDGRGYIELSLDKKISVEYKNNGDYNWTFKVEYGTGSNITTLYTRTKVRIAQTYRTVAWKDRHSKRN